MAVCVILTTHPKAPRYEQVRESETSQQLAELLLSLNTPSCPHHTILFPHDHSPPFATCR